MTVLIDWLSLSWPPVIHPNCGACVFVLFLPGSPVFRSWEWKTGAISKHSWGHVGGGTYRFYLITISSAESDFTVRSGQKNRSYEATGKQTETELQTWSSKMLRVLQISPFFLFCWFFFHHIFFIHVIHKWYIGAKGGVHTGQVTSSSEIRNYPRMYIFGLSGEAEPLHTDTKGHSNSTQKGLSQESNPGDTNHQSGNSLSCWELYMWASIWGFRINNSNFSPPFSINHFK